MQGVHAAGGRGAPGRRRVGALMGGRAQIHLGIREDEVVEMDELASAKQASAKCPRARTPSRSGLLSRRSSRRAAASSAAATARQERRIEPGGDPVGPLSSLKDVSDKMIIFCLWLGLKRVRIFANDVTNSTVRRTGRKPRTSYIFRYRFP